MQFQKDRHFAYGSSAERNSMTNIITPPSWLDDALEFCRQKGLKAQKGLAETLPYQDETFDLTTALDVVEHLDDDIGSVRRDLVDEKMDAAIAD